MKIDRIELLTALRATESGLIKKEGILQGDCFVFVNNQVATYNDSVAVSYPFEFDIEGAVKASELLSLLNKVKDKEIEVFFKDNELRVKGKKFNSGITMEEKIELPLDFLKTKIKYKELPEGFSEAVQLCSFSTAAESRLPHLSNVHIKNGIVESTDNFRATRISMGNKVKEELLIPVSAVSGLRRYNFTHYGLSEDGMSEGWIHLTKENGAVFSCRVFEEGFPDIGQFFEAKGTPIRLPPELSEILDKGEIFQEEEKGQLVVTITIEGKKLTILSENINGWYEESVDLKRAFEKGVSFKASPKILKDILKYSNRAVVSDRVMKFKAKKFDHVVALIPT